MKKKPFPKEVYLKWEYPQSDSPYLLAHVDVSDVAEINTDVRVGVYKLVRVATVTAAAKLV